MKISKELGVGINALSLIKKSKDPISTDVLADKVGTTAGFLGQIMKKLRKSQIVYAKHGPGGGYILSERYLEVTAFDVATALGYQFRSEDSGTIDKLNAEIGNAFMKIKI